MLSLYHITFTYAVVSRCRVPFPAEGILWRGGSLADEHSEFFYVGLKYRQPAMMSSTDNKTIADR